MHVNYLLLVAAVTLSRCDAAATDRDADILDMDSLVRIHAVRSNDYGNRFLRAGPVRSDTDDVVKDSNDEERMAGGSELEKLSSGHETKLNKWLAKRLDEFAEKDLGPNDKIKLPKNVPLTDVLSWMNDKNAKIFERFASEGKTPSIMYKNLDIEEKLQTKTIAQLNHDEEFQLWYHYKVFWDAHHA